MLVVLNVPLVGVFVSPWCWRRAIGGARRWKPIPAPTSGVIWCAPARQAELHPVSISHYLGQGFNAEFD